MGKDHIWDSTQWDRKIRPKKTLGFNTVGRKTRWSLPVYGLCPYMVFARIWSLPGENPRENPREIPREIPRENPREIPRENPRENPREIPRENPREIPRENPTQLAGKPDPNTIYGQRPYMGFNTVGQENQTQKTIGFNTVGRKTRPRDHIWAKTIYGIQHSGTGRSDPKDDRIQHSWQENQTQRPYMGKDHIWDSTQWDKETGPKDHRSTKLGQGNQTQRPYMGFNTVGQRNRTQRP